MAGDFKCHIEWPWTRQWRKTLSNLLLYHAAHAFARTFARYCYSWHWNLLASWIKLIGARHDFQWTHLKRFENLTAKGSSIWPCARSSCTSNGKILQKFEILPRRDCAIKGGSGGSDGALPDLSIQLTPIWRIYGNVFTISISLWILVWCGSGGSGEGSGWLQWFCDVMYIPVLMRCVYIWQ